MGECGTETSFSFFPPKCRDWRGGVTPCPHITPGSTELTRNQERLVTCGLERRDQTPSHRWARGQEFSGRSLHCLPVPAPAPTSTWHGFSASTPGEREKGPPLTMGPGCAKETTRLGVVLKFYEQAEEKQNMVLLPFLSSFRWSFSWRAGDVRQGRDPGTS